METGLKISQIKNNKDKILSNELSIQVSLNGLSFCVLNTDTNEVVYSNTLSFNKKLTPHALLDQLKHCFNSFKELQDSFSNIHVIHENELSSLVPKTVFNEDALADYLKFNSRILQSDYITYDNILANDSVNVYVPYVNINNYLYETFGSFEYKHSSSILIENLLAAEKNSEELKMFVHVANSHFEILVIENGKLLLYNTFNYQTKEDFIYYILFVAEQLNLNPEAFKLVLLGAISKNDEYYSIAYNYIRNVEIYALGNVHSISSEVDEKNYPNYIINNSF